jgi:diguanylate cyclase (GGDEF)-like protein
MWLTGWLMILLHFVFSLFQSQSQFIQAFIDTVILSSLVWAGILFMAATIPDLRKTSSRCMRWTLLAVNTFLITLLISVTTPVWLLYLGAALTGLAPLTVYLFMGNADKRITRRMIVVLYMALSLLLLLTVHLPNFGEIALGAVLSTVYLGCCIYFWTSYSHATAGSFVTIAGFLAWASVFIIGPLLGHFRPDFQIENEVWNLPKYVVAVGMILLMLEEQIEHNKFLALHDELTGLANRRLFQDRLTTAMERSRRNGTQTALLLFDLDRFKQVNDTLGHHVGDLLLQHVAHCFAERVRKSDTVARTGGDEFAVILEEPTSRSNAQHIGDALLQLLEKPVILDQKLIHTGASLGVAIFPDDAPTEEALRIVADMRMYEHKNARRATAQGDTSSHFQGQSDADGNLANGLKLV